MLQHEVLSEGNTELKTLVNNKAGRENVEGLAPHQPFPLALLVEQHLGCIFYFFTTKFAWQMTL